MDITVGVDIIEIDRIKRTLTHFGERFLERIYTPQEINYCKGRAERLASRFAAKEAVMKALGTGIRGVGWKEVEVIRERGHAPTIELHGRAAKTAHRMGVRKLALSLSHSKLYAVASVVGQRE